MPINSVGNPLRNPHEEAAMETKQGKREDGEKRGSRWIQFKMKEEEERERGGCVIN